MNARGGGGLFILLMVLLLAGCSDKSQAPAGQAAVNAEYLARENAWREQRQVQLREPDGWASLVGLHWIELNAHFIGKAPGNGMRLGIGPDTLGLVTRSGEQVWFTPAAGVNTRVQGQPVKGRVRMFSDHDPLPTSVDFDEGKGRLTLIQLGERVAIRTSHADAQTRLQFAGLEYWPVDPTWRIYGRYRPNTPGKVLEVMDVNGTYVKQPNVGVIEFERAGKQYRLEAIAKREGGLLLMFTDHTNGQGSYSTGRYIDVLAADAGGNVVVDFNRAYNPPCAFTSFATCPIAPTENQLDLEVTAGEKDYKKPSLKQDVS